MLEFDAAALSSNDQCKLMVSALDAIGRFAGKAGYTCVTDRLEMPRWPGGEGRQRNKYLCNYLFLFIFLYYVHDEKTA